MKITVKKADIEAAVQIANIAVGDSDEAKIASQLLFRIKGGKLEIFGSNFGAAGGGRLLAGGPVQDAVLEEATDGAEFTVPAWRLVRLIALLKANEDLVLTYDEATKSTRTNKGGKFASLDPKQFPRLDKTIEESTVTVDEIESATLVPVFSYVRQFVSDQDKRQPTLVTMACLDGVVSATDSVGFAMVKVPGMEKSSLRVHGKDISSALSFMSIKGSEKLSFREHDQALILWRADNKFLAIGRWPHEWPKNLKIDRTTAPMSSFTVRSEDMQRATKLLEVFSKKDDSRINVSFDTTGNLVLSMQDAADDSAAEQVVECVQSSNLGDIAAAGHDTFTISNRFLQKIIDAASGEPITFGVSWKKQNGFITVARKDAAHDYFTLIVWLKK